MLKKILAGTLGVSMILTSLAADSFSKLNANKSDRSQATQKELTEQTEPIRSLSDIHAEAEPIDLANTGKVEAKPEVSNVEFDIETGELKVWTKQDRNAQLVVSIIPEEGRESQLDMKTSLIPEPMTVSTFSVDTETLPEYFEIRAVIADEISGLELSESFNYRYYTESIQKMAKTYATDFDEEYVVNLDEDEKTNFLVLNENTIVAESDESKNTIVKADYESNVYELENIDDTVKDLKAGDSFFAKSDEAMVAVTVKAIEIEDEKATITGDEQLGTVFDFVKIDTRFTDEYAVADVEEATGISSEVKADDYMSLGDYKVGAGINVEGFKLVDYPGETEAKELELRDFKVDPKLKINLNANVIIYLSLQDKEAYVEAVFDTPIDSSAAITLKDKNEVVLLPKKCYEPGKELADYCLFLKTKISLVLEAATTLNLSCKFDPTFGFIFDSTAKSGEKLTTITAMNFKSEDVSAAVDISGKGFFGFKYDVNLSFFDIEDIGINGKIGFDFVSQQELYNSEVKKYMPGIYQPENKEFDAIHTCDVCVEGTLTLVADLALAMKVKFPFDDKALYEDKAPLWDEKIVSADYHMSLNANATGGTHIFPEDWPFLKDIEIGFGKCPHKAYRTTFNVFIEDEDGERVPIPNAKLLVYPKYLENQDLTGKEVFTDSNGQAVLYLADISDPFSFDGEKISEKSYMCKVYGYDDYFAVLKTFSVTYDAREVDIKIDKETAKESFSSSKHEKQTTTSFNVTQTLPATIPNHRADRTPVQVVKLGDNITGSVYPLNGSSDESYVSIIGYGEMNVTGCVFKNKEKIKEVVINNVDPKNGLVITSLGKHLFDGCSNLRVAVIPDTLTSIGDSAFNGCANLITVTYKNPYEIIKDANGKEKKVLREVFEIPETLKEYGSNAFNDCLELSVNDLKIHDGITRIGNSAFGGCLKMTSVDVPGSVESLGHKAFQGCINLKKAVINEGVKKFEQDSDGHGTYFQFYNCESLEELTLPYAGWEEGTYNEYDSTYPNAGNDRNNIGGLLGSQVLDDKYYDNGLSFYRRVPKSLEKVTILGGTKVQSQFFNNCSFIKKVILPDTITEVGNYAFSGCTSLEFGDYTIPSNIRIIGNSAYAYCYGMTSVTIPDTVESLGENAFAYCKNLKKAVLKNGNVIIRENVHNSWTNLFSYCESLTEFVLPQNISKIGMHTFYECNNLSTIYYNGTKAQWDEKVKDNISEEGNDVVTECYNEENGRKIVYLGGAAVPDAPLYGDANCDGKVTLSDALAVLQFVANEDKYPLTEEGQKNADCVDAGKGITAQDALAIQMVDTELIDISELPVAASALNR